MNDLESLEQTLKEWKARPPSAALAGRLFGRKESRPDWTSPRRAEFWSWLTPVAACALTLLVAVGSTGHRANSLAGKAGTFALAGLTVSSPSSNFLEGVQLSEMDENVRWNICPVLSSNARAAATNLNRSF